GHRGGRSGADRGRPPGPHRRDLRRSEPGDPDHRSQLRRGLRGREHGRARGAAALALAPRAPGPRQRPAHRHGPRRAAGADLGLLAPLSARARCRPGVARGPRRQSPHARGRGGPRRPALAAAPRLRDPRASTAGHAMRNLGGLVLMLAVALLLRSTALSSLAARGVVLDVLAFTTVVWALRHGETSGATFGFVLGLAADLDAAHWLGRHALILALIGYGVGRLNQTLMRDRTATHLILLVAATVAHQGRTPPFQARGVSGLAAPP